MYKVLDKNGILYSDKSGKIKKFSEGNIIRQVDIDNNFITLGGLVNLEKEKRVKKIKVVEENKQQPKGDEK